MTEPFYTPLFFRLAKSRTFLAVVIAVWTLSAIGFCYFGPNPDLSSGNLSDSSAPANDSSKTVVLWEPVLPQ